METLELWAVVQSHCQDPFLGVREEHDFLEEIEVTTKDTLHCNHPPTVKEITPPQQKHVVASTKRYLRLKRAETQISNSISSPKPLPYEHHYNMFKTGSPPAV
ncbi:hypothetical protein TNCV_1881751 [Trichonephila clavipes]|nr:hypothetical protein TNCV_1881751 [Trichonephila clavipes]